MNTGPRSASQRLPLVVSADGYVRLTLAAYGAMQLAHLLSGLDVDAQLPSGNGVGASVASITGYTEWASHSASNSVSHARAVLSLGWDWRIATGAGRVYYQRDGEVRSNVMLLDSRLRDLGARATDALLRAAIDRLDWTTAVEQFIGNRYRHPDSNRMAEAW